MPCNDITDILRLRIDDDNKIDRYALTKLSCGGKVGPQTLILEWAQIGTADDFLKTTANQLLDKFPTEDPLDEYLLLKQYFSVRAGVSILLGKESGGLEDFCTVDAIRYTEKGVELRALIKVDAITDEIKSCGRCCSS